MRYPDDGGLTAAGRTRRERVRLAAAAMYEHGMKPVQVAHERRRWRAWGTAALAAKGPRGAVCRLGSLQLSLAEGGAGAVPGRLGLG